MVLASGFVLRVGRGQGQAQTTTPFFPAKTPGLGIPWWSSGEDSALSLLSLWVRSLVRELRSGKPPSTAKTATKRFRGPQSSLSV